MKRLLLIASLPLALVPVTAAGGFEAGTPAGAQSPLEGRVSLLESRLSQLEARVASLESRGQGGGTTAGRTGGGWAAPVGEGFESVHVMAHQFRTGWQVQVKVNGRVVGTYNA